MQRNFNQHISMLIMYQNQECGFNKNAIIFNGINKSETNYI